MIEQDTVKLLRECDAGIKMGVYSIEEVLGDVDNGNFKQMLEKAKSDRLNIRANTSVNLLDFKMKFKYFLTNTTTTAKILILWLKVCRGLKRI